MMRRSPFAMFLMVGFGLLLGAALFGGVESVGAVLAAPFIVLGFVFKVAFFFLLFGLFARFIGRRAGRHWDDGEVWKERWEQQRREWSPPAGRRHGRPTGRPEAPSGPRTEDRFEEWHRLAHARQEVDDHVPPVET